MAFFTMGNRARTTGVALVIGSPPPLTGKAAFAAARAHGAADPLLLSRLALLLLTTKPGAEVLTGPAPANADIDIPARERNLAKAPHVAGDTLEFWTVDYRAGQVVRWRVKLGSGEIKQKIGNEI
jgi:hypothetical protein